MLRRDCGYFEHMNEFETRKINERKNVIFAKKVNKKTNNWKLGLSSHLANLSLYSPLQGKLAELKVF